MNFFLKHLENLENDIRSLSHFAFYDICTNSFFDTEFCCLLLGYFGINIGNAII